MGGFLVEVVMRRWAVLFGLALVVSGCVRTGGGGGGDVVSADAASVGDDVAATGGDIEGSDGSDSDVAGMDAPDSADVLSADVPDSDTAPDVDTADGGVPDTEEPDVSDDIVDGEVPDVDLPAGQDVGVPDTALPDTATPDTDGADSEVPDAGAMDGGGPDSGEPDVDEPDVEEPPLCENLVQNIGETDVDCGGPCPPCANTKFCKLHSDCLSATCIFGICESPSCDDEILNGKETAVDCGGSQCPGCPLGSVCEVSGDCSDGICEDGVCCTANACGTCGELPPDTCNGEDDDCDGATDEDHILQMAPACPKISGVCFGVVAACSGGWSCSDATYTAWSDDYEAVESTCDEKDNDCDGETDEGLLNACGGCGPLPADTCNGVDDDCDGFTDEDADPANATDCPSEGVCVGLEATCLGEAGWGCDTGSIPTYQAVETACDGLDNDCNGETDESAKCTICEWAISKVVFVDSEYTDYQEYVGADFHPSNDDLYFAVRTPSSDADVLVSRIVDGSPVKKMGVPIAAMDLKGGTPAMAVSADSVWVVGYVEGYKLGAVQLDLALTETIGEWTGPQETTEPVVLGDGRIIQKDVGLAAGLFVADTWSTTQSLTAWAEDISFVSLGFDPVVSRQAPWIVGFKAKQNYGEDNETDLKGIWLVDSGEHYILGDDNTSNGVQTILTDKFGTTHLLYKQSIDGVGTLVYRSLKDGALTSPEPIAESKEGHLVLTANGTPLVTYDAKDTINLAQRTNSGWTTDTWVDPSGDSLGWHWAGQDSSGRLLLLWRSGYSEPIGVKLFCDVELTE